MSSSENTHEYTQAELEKLMKEMSERAERLAGLEPGTPEYDAADKAFSDEINRRNKSETE